MTEPLGQGLKMFNQRLLAEHCLSEVDARALWDDIRQQQADVVSDMNGTTFEESIASSNKELDFIGLEIVGISLPDKSSMVDEEQEEDDENITRKSKKTKKRKNVIYYSIINRFPDEIAKKCFQSMFTSQEQGYVRLVLEKLVEKGPTSRNVVLNYKNLLDDSTGPGSSQSQRLSILSQRSGNNNNEHDEDDQNDLVAVKRPALTLSMVEDVLEKLLEEKWLICGHADSGNSNNSNRRRSSNSFRIDIGPRGYMELSKILTEEFGLDKDDLPQQIYHRN
jgi:Nse1 non-SMC component of SMC5-6 complex